MTLTDIAERAKTSTEAQVRAARQPTDQRMTLDKLRDLAKAKGDASYEYNRHKPGENLTPDQQVQFDLRDRMLLKACTAARIAYEDALEKYAAQS